MLILVHNLNIVVYVFCPLETSAARLTLEVHNAYSVFLGLLESREHPDPHHIRSE
jgi:hypothetical protein